MRTTEAGFGISDLKTDGTIGTDGAAVTAGHGAQLGVYELQAEHGLGVPISGSVPG